MISNDKKKNTLCTKFLMLICALFMGQNLFAGHHKDRSEKMFSKLKLEDTKKAQLKEYMSSYKTNKMAQKESSKAEREHHKTQMSNAINSGNSSQIEGIFKTLENMKIEKTKQKMSSHKNHILKIISIIGTDNWTQFIADNPKFIKKLTKDKEGCKNCHKKRGKGKWGKKDKNSKGKNGKSHDH